MKAIVTGASSGIGKAIYEWLGRREFEVTGISRRGPDHNIDLATDPIPEQRHDSRGACDVLVLNHGVLSFDEISSRENLVAVNLTSYFRALSNQAHDRCPVKQGGCIILNASVCGVVGDKDVPLYAALKAGVINLAKSYAKILMPQGIRVNAFSCGFFKTNLVPGDTPQELIDTIPMKREADPNEILPVIDMLINTPYMTGQNIIIDGGLSL